MRRFIRFLTTTSFGSCNTAVHRSCPWLEVLEDRQVPSASPLDLTTTGAQGNIGGVIFEQGSTQPSGSGVFMSFVRIHALGGALQEQGYNTDARPL
jgi:hypothetical protein